MPRNQKSILSLATYGLVGILAALLVSASLAHAEEKEKVVVPFDFVSKFDKGRYGEMVGDLVAKKLERQGGFSVPEMTDVRDLCATNNIKITPDTPLDEVKQVVRGTFDADIAIWGSIERVPGVDWEEYDLVIKCVDFTSGQQPKVIYESSARTKSAGEISHLYVKEMLDKLYERGAPAAKAVDQVAEANWRKNPNLVKGGDFERGAGGVPLGWESLAGQQRDPLGKEVVWGPETGNPKNRVVRFNISRDVAETTGLMYYSHEFPVTEGATYRFQVRYRTNGPSPKVFIKCYAEMGSEYKENVTAAAPGSKTKKSSASQKEGASQEIQRRECYRSQQNLKGPPNTWNVQTEDFTPKHTKYSPKWGRVMLYGYLTPGVIEWDDVVVKEIVPGPSSAPKKNLRHSMDSNVTIDQMQQNEARGQQSRKKLERGKD